MKIDNEADVLCEFNNFVEKIECPKLKQVCYELKNYIDFWTFPASVGHHHSFYGGLILHTLEVTFNALHGSLTFKSGNDDILTTACLWHDLAKIWDYKAVNGLFDSDMKPIPWVKADYHGKIHHVSGSMAEFTAVAMKYEVERSVIQKIQHCIISHHGTKEWGSPRRPESLEAILLHQADMLSAMHPTYTKSLT